jgi:hypothetical protein
MLKKKSIASCVKSPSVERAIEMLFYPGKLFLGDWYALGTMVAESHRCDPCRELVGLSSSPTLEA